MSIGAAVKTGLVRLSGVTCAYDATPVIEDVDLTIEAGDFVGVVGPSGSG